MRNKGIILGAACSVAALFAVPAAAVPITTPPVLTGLGGPITAVYVFAGANDTSFLSEMSPASFPNIFCNHPSGSCTGNMAGDTKPLGSQTGPLVFTLRNVTTGVTYTSDMTDSSGAYHVKVATDYSSFGMGPLPGAAATVLAGLNNVTYVGWEDLDSNNGGDYDYNDLIFAFSNTKGNDNPGVPEPLTLSLMGAGLLGLAGLRGRRKKA